jgi:GGDEF domain-containing protein
VNVGGTASDYRNEKPTKGLGDNHIMIPSIDHFPMTPVRRGAAVKLLRMAKIQCGASAGVCVVQESDGSLAITSYPDFSEFGQTADVPWSPNEISDLASRIWLDPHMGHEQPLVRAMSLGATVELRPIAFVAATTIDDESRGLRGVVFVLRNSDVAYSIEDLTALQIVRRRFTDHLRAVQDLAEAEYFDLEQKPQPPIESSHQAPIESSYREQTQPQSPPAVSAQPRPSESEATPDLDSHDAAIGLPTIGPFIDHLKGLVERNDRPNMMVVLIDLDGEPSELTSRLILASRQLHRSIRRDDFVARVGRTIFGIAIELPGDATMNDAEIISDRLAATAESAIGIENGEWFVRASVALKGSSMPEVDDDPRSSSEIATALVQQAWTRLQTP